MDHKEQALESQLTDLVARGDAIIAELYRLVDLARLISSSLPANTLSALTADFSYFKSPDTFEARIESSAALKAADSDFCDRHGEHLARFYQTLECVFVFARDLASAVADACYHKSGPTSSNTINHYQSILQVSANKLNSVDLKKVFESIEPTIISLLAEAHYLLGFMLLAVDLTLAGDTRERLIVAYYRYSASRSSLHTNLDGVCALLRSTGFSANSQLTLLDQNNNLQQQKQHQKQHHCRPVEYPAAYLRRARVDERVLECLVARLTLHSTGATAQSHQMLDSSPSQLLVLTLFCPQLAANNRQVMRSIADRFFASQFVVPLVSGELLDVGDVWAPFAAARNALESALASHDSLDALIADKRAQLDCAVAMVNNYLTVGRLTSRVALDEHASILGCIRDANRALGWWTMHASDAFVWRLGSDLVGGASKTASSINNNNNNTDKNQTSTTLTIVRSSQRAPNSFELYELLRKLAELEAQFLKRHCKLLAERQVRIDCLHASAERSLCELRTALATVSASASALLQHQQHELKLVVDSLIKDLDKQDHSTDWTPICTQFDAAANKLQAAIAAPANQTSALARHMRHLRPLLCDASNSAHGARKLLALQDETSFTLTLWQLADTSQFDASFDAMFAQHLQREICSKPRAVRSLAALVSKLCASLELRAQRVQRSPAATRADTIAVCSAHGAQLVTRVQRALGSLPEALFRLALTPLTASGLPPCANLLQHLHHDQNRSTHNNLRVPSRVAADKLRELARASGERAKLAKLSAEAAHCAEGVLQMHKTRIGPSLVLNARKLLRDGIRRELVTRASVIIYSSLSSSSTAPKSTKPASLRLRLGKMRRELAKLRAALQLVQDFALVDGERLWRDELARVVKLGGELAVAGASMSPSGAASAYELARVSVHQSVAAPVPVLAADPLKASCIARLTHELLESGSSSASNSTTNLKVLLADIGDCLGAAALNCIDAFSAALLVVELQALDATLIAACKQLKSTRTSSTPAPTTIMSLADVQRLAATDSSARSMLATLASCLSKLGKLQILRSELGAALKTRACRDSRQILAAATTLDFCVRTELRSCGGGSSCSAKDNSSGGGIAGEQPTPTTNNAQQLLVELSRRLDWLGAGDSRCKSYGSLRVCAHHGQSCGAVLALTVALAASPSSSSLVSQISREKTTPGSALARLVGGRKPRPPPDLTPLAAGLELLLRHLTSVGAGANFNNASHEQLAAALRQLVAAGVVGTRAELQKLAPLVLLSTSEFSLFKPLANNNSTKNRTFALTSDEALPALLASACGSNASSNSTATHNRTTGAVTPSTTESRYYYYQ